MSSATDFAKMVPGFDFLQGLMKGAGGALPGMGQWIAPTLDPKELERRIDELRTVQFWLEQNAKLLGTTIQALEVQRMTLATLQTMNLPLAEVREALKVPTPSAPSPTPATASTSASAAAAKARKSPRSAKAAGASSASAAAASKVAPMVDPMQWWGALTQQFTELATKAMKDSGTEAARQIGGALVKQSVKQSVETAGGALKKAAGMAGNVAGTLAAAPAKAAARSRRR
jgi:hypothetical protein